MTEALQVKFLKGSDELAIQEGVTTMGQNAHDESYVYKANDGNSYLMASNGVGRVTRFHFHRGDVSGEFSSEQLRRKYMDRINAAAGESVCVPAEAA